MIVHGILVCISFLISVCMFIVSKAVLLSSATVIVGAGGAIWLNPFATVLFNVWISVAVERCVCTCVVWVCLECLLLCKEESSYPVSLQLLRGGIWASMRYLVNSQYFSVWFLFLVNVMDVLIVGGGVQPLSYIPIIPN